MINPQAKFVREKNSLFYGDDFEIVEPTHEEKIILLKDKFNEKAEYVSSAFDCEKMYRYFTRKAEKNNSDSDTYKKIAENIQRDNCIPKFVQKRFLTRVLVDFIQLENDLLYVLGIKKGLTYKKKCRFMSDRTFDADTVCNELKKQCSNLQNPDGSESYFTACLIKIHRLVEELASYYKIPFNELKTLKMQIEEKEGRFSDGKLVLRIMNNPDNLPK